MSQKGAYIGLGRLGYLAHPKGPPVSVDQDNVDQLTRSNF